MPIYQYQCEKCNTIFEKLLKKQSNKKANCPDCEGMAVKIPGKTTFVLKGSGWATDGYSPKK
jgi:putative FmdB family regulatory protein